MKKIIIEEMEIITRYFVKAKYRKSNKESMLDETEFEIDGYMPVKELIRLLEDKFE